VLDCARAALCARWPQALHDCRRVPFNKNHADLTPPPFNLTALNWVWNAAESSRGSIVLSTGLPCGL